MDPVLARKHALEFLKAHRTGVLSTVDAAGKPQGRTIYFTCDEHFNIYFLTLADTRKFETLGANPHVAFTVSDTETPQTLQVEGVAMDITLDEEAIKKREELFTVLSANPWYGAPIEKMGPGAPVVVWIKPHWIRFVDYAFGPDRPERIYQEIPLDIER